VVTIRNVADKAGVSIGTVSRALNNKQGVGEETRQRVFDVANELGYRIPKREFPSSAEITHLGLLNRPIEGGLMSNPFYHDVFIGIDQICREHHITLSVSSLDIVDEFLHSSPFLLENEDIAGLVLVGAMSRGVISALLAQTVLPIILIDNYFPEYDLDAVIIDNSRGVKLAVEHLIAQGHRQISFIDGPDHPSIVERHCAYVRTMQQHQLSPYTVRRSCLNVEDGASGAAEIMQQRPETTAMISANDLQAIGAMRELQRLGYEVPRDISIIGFDDIELAQFTSPSINTLHVDLMALGQIATRMLFTRISNPDRPMLTNRVCVKLVERESVARPCSRPGMNLPGH
jgi:LacI family transcriptional regulator